MGMIQVVVYTFRDKNWVEEFTGSESVDEIAERLERAAREAKYLLPFGVVPPEFEEKLRIIKRCNFGNYLGLLVDEMLEDIALDRALQSGQSVVRR
jgi:hypothetical protein